MIKIETCAKKNYVRAETKSLKLYSYSITNFLHFQQNNYFFRWYRFKLRYRESIFVGFSCIRIHQGMSGIGLRKTDRREVFLWPIPDIPRCILIQEKPTNILSMTYIPSILLILIIFKIIFCPVLHKRWKWFVLIMILSNILSN